MMHSLRLIGDFAVRHRTILFRAFTLAGQAGFDSIETDVNETKDGVFVLSHDNNLSSICGVNVNISDLTYEELCNYSKYNIKIGNGVGNYNNYERRIPRLDEFLDICEQYGCIPQLDTNESEFL